MLKILHINCSCTGSTGKIIGDIADHAADAGFETLLCAPCAPGTNQNIRYFRASLPYEQGVYRRLNYLYGYQYGFAPLSTIKIKHIIKKEKPDLIHLHCVNSFMVNVYSLLRLIKMQEIPVVITNHAEFFYTGGCPHAYDCQRWLVGCGQCPQKAEATGAKLWDTSAAAWKRMKDAFSGLENAVMVSVSPWVRSRAERSPITKGLPQVTVLNGVNTDVFTWRNRAVLRAKYALPENKKIVFHPTANFSASEKDRKGGKFVIELAKRLSDGNVIFVVAGKYPPGLTVPENMILLGMVSDQKMLAEYYALADVTVVTGQRETFNMPVAESLCCGTPVAGFMAGGPESVAMEQYSRFAEYADVTGLEQHVAYLLAETYDRQDISRQAEEKYSATSMANGYMSIYKQILLGGGDLTGD